MPPIPTGTITFLFTDIEGSTRLWEQAPQAMDEALRRHDELMRSAVERWGGHVFKTVGDAFCVAFSTAEEALEASASAQRALAAEPWPEAATLRVRMALHTGGCVERDGDYFGPALNRAARLEATAHGSQVVLSQTTTANVRDSLPAGVSLRPLGPHRLKDLGRPEEISQLVIEGLDADFPPLRSLDNPEMPNNLPQLVSSFVGRDAEVSEVRALVEHSRLVTLSGAGGSGKTRLALQVAAELLDGSGDGVWLVELADVSDPDLVASAVSRALGIKEQPAHDVPDSLLGALADLHLLIVLDNCEHVITSCAKLADAILRRCPRVHLLATSREPLGIDGESVWPVAPLSLPPDAPEELAALAASGAVALFLDRALSQNPGFALTEENAPVVASVCRRLDGMPLAIELAVARLRSLSLVDLNNRLDRRFQLLTGGSRSALPRHQTLRGVVDWSYDLLTEPEQVLFRRLSVFSGGFELDAAEDVCGFGAIEEFDVTVLLGGLVDKSLVVADASTMTIRYRLLETIRQYAAERLADVGRDETHRLFDTHAEFYLTFAEIAAPQLTGPDHGTQFVRLETEYPNLYAALEHLSGRGDQREHALRLAVALRHFLHGIGATSGEIPLLNGILERPDPEIPTPLIAAALLCRADLLRDIDLAASLQSGKEALELARKCSDRKLIADTASFHSMTMYFQGDAQEALDLANEAIASARQCGDPVLIGASLTCLANAVEETDLPLAERLYAESITLGERSGDWSGLWRSHNNLAILLMNLERLSEAREHFESALVAASTGASRVDADIVLANLGFLLLREGDTDGAATSFAHYLRTRGATAWS